MCSYLACPSDAIIIVGIILILFVISVLVYLFTKKIFFSIVLFSLLANIIFYWIINYRIATTNNIFWLFVFTRKVWPIVNIILLASLIIKIFTNKNAKKIN